MDQNKAQIFEKLLLRDIDSNDWNEFRDNLHLAVKYLLGKRGAGTIDVLNRTKVARWAEELSKKSCRHAYSQEIVKYKVDFHELPLSDEEGGEMLEGGVIYSPCGPLGTVSACCHKVKVVTDMTAQILCGPDSPLMRNLSLCQEYRLPVAIGFGGSPVHKIAAKLPLPLGFDFCNLEAMMTHRGTLVTQCMTQPLEVPADCRCIAEGYIQKNEERPGGFPVFHLGCLSFSKKAAESHDIGQVPDEIENPAVAKAVEIFMFDYLRFAVDPGIKSLSVPADEGKPVAVEFEEPQYGTYTPEETAAHRARIRQRISEMFRRPVK